MTFNPRGETDIVIPVMGQTGVGKSTFINEILKGKCSDADSIQTQALMEVGYSLCSCTKTIEVAVLPHHPDGTRILLVDTPGFDDTYEADQVTVKRIADWLKSSYDDPKSVIAGVIYLHDISQDRFAGAAQRSLEIFESLCGAPAFDKVILGTTKHTKIDDTSIVLREKELCGLPWKSMIDKGARVLHYRDDYLSAQAFIDQVLGRFASDTVLEIQKELSIQKKPFSQTAAGRQTIKHQILQISNQRAMMGDSISPEAKKEFTREEQKLLKQLHLSKVPDSLSLRIRKMLGIKSPLFKW